MGNTFRLASIHLAGSYLLREVPAPQGPRNCSSETHISGLAGIGTRAAIPVVWQSFWVLSPDVGRADWPMQGSAR
jgi:hypothetical protein